jgi:hypothetical protein
MPNLTSVTLTAGLPTAGTGTVSTLDNLVGAAGTASAQVVTVQGIASMTAVKVDGSAVTQPVSIATAPVLVAGSAIIGKVTTDQTTHGTTDLVAADITKVAGSAIAQGHGTAAAAIRVELPSDGTGVVRTADGSGNLLTSTGSALDINVKSGGNSNGQAVMASSAPVTMASDQRYQTGMSPRAFAVAFSTLTRPANTTPYSAADSISDNATAGSVTALTATVSDTNDDLLTLTDILVSSTDTGLAGKRIRAYLFNTDPTASSGVGGGDNAAYSQKKAGYIGSMSGVLETGFSDGTVGRLVPSFNDSATAPVPNAPAGGFVVTKPVSGAKTLFIQYQTLDVFTPSANSTTIIGTVRGFQGRTA